MLSVLLVICDPLFDVFFGRQILHVPWNMQTGHTLTFQRNDVIDVVAIWAIPVHLRHLVLEVFGNDLTGYASLPDYFTKLSG